MVCNGIRWYAMHTIGIWYALVYNGMHEEKTYGKERNQGKTGSYTMG